MFLLCHLLSQNSLFILFVYVSNSDISLNRFLLCIILIWSVYYLLVISYICFYFCFNMEIQKITLDQKTSKLITSLLAENQSNIPQIEAYNSLYSHDFIWISETYFDSTILGDKSFHLSGYNLLRADHLNNTKRGGACIYYEVSQDVHEVKLSSLSQWVICEVPLQICKEYSVLFTGPQGKTVPNLKIFYLTWMNFKVKLLQPSSCLP